MDQVFAPWRIEWVTRDVDPEADDGCVFCSFVSSEDERANRVVARSEHAYVLLNNAPYNPGHVMVIPNRHTGDYAALPDDELLDHSKLVQRTLRALDRAFSPDAYNTGLNLGQGAGGPIGDHLHTHVVPRWVGDTNFMAVVADTKVIVEGLEDSYERLHAAFAAADDVVVDGPDQAVVVDRS